MKIKILKKTQKDGVSASGVPYTIRNLFVSFEDAKLFEKIKNYLREKQGATTEQIDRFISESEYKGVTSYVFWLNSSPFTFDAVERFGILDADIQFRLNNSGYINANIRRERNKEVVSEYLPPDGFVDGWTGVAAPPKRTEEEDLSTAPNLSGLGASDEVEDVEYEAPGLEGEDFDNKLPF